MSSRVFVVQEPFKKDDTGNVVSRFPLAPMQAYGELVYVFDWSALRRVGMEPTDAVVDRLVWHAREVLRDFDDNDYLVPVGNPALIAIASLVAGECNDGRVRLLDWMRQEGAYRLFDIDMECDDPLAPVRVAQ